MAEHAHHFLLLTLLGFCTVLLVFGMKYFAAGKQARLRFAGEGAYRGSPSRRQASSPRARRLSPRCSRTSPK